MSAEENEKSDVTIVACLFRPDKTQFEIFTEKKCKITHTPSVEFTYYFDELTECDGESDIDQNTKPFQSYADMWRDVAPIYVQNFEKVVLYHNLWRDGYNGRIYENYTDDLKVIDDTYLKDLEAKGVSLKGVPDFVSNANQTYLGSGLLTCMRLGALVGREYKKVFFVDTDNFPAPEFINQIKAWGKSDDCILSYRQDGYKKRTLYPLTDSDGDCQDSFLAGMTGIKDSVYEDLNENKVTNFLKDGIARLNEKLPEGCSYWDEGKLSYASWGLDELVLSEIVKNHIKNKDIKNIKKYEIVPLPQYLHEGRPKNKICWDLHYMPETEFRIPLRANLDYYNLLLKQEKQEGEIVGGGSNPSNPSSLWVAAGALVLTTLASAFR